MTFYVWQTRTPYLEIHGPFSRDRAAKSRQTNTLKLLLTPCQHLQNFPWHPANTFVNFISACHWEGQSLRNKYFWDASETILETRLTKLVGKCPEYFTWVIKKYKSTRVVPVLTAYLLRTFYRRPWVPQVEESRSHCVVSFVVYLGCGVDRRRQRESRFWNLRQCRCWRLNRLLNVDDLRDHS